MRNEVAGVERLQRMPDDDALPRRGVVWLPDRGGDRVQKLIQRDGRWTPRVGALVRSCVDDYEVARRGQHRIEQQLPVLAAHVPLADARVPGEHVVAVVAGRAWEDAV